MLFGSDLQHMLVFICANIFQTFVALDRDSCTNHTRCTEAGHGRCVLRDPSDCQSGTKCICHDGYTGQYCNRPPHKPCDRCHSGPSCSTCTHSIVFNSKYHLLSDRDSCTGYHHCGAHGRCALSDPTNCMSKPMCVCNEGYTGTYCTEQPCKSCFSGPTCATCKPFDAMVSRNNLCSDRDSCTGYNHCHSSGHGHCMLRDPTNCTSGAMCMCDAGYTGTYCTEQPCKACYFGPTCATCKAITLTLLDEYLLFRSRQLLGLYALQCRRPRLLCSARLERLHIGTNVQVYRRIHGKVLHRSAMRSLLFRTIMWHM